MNVGAWIIFGVLVTASVLHLLSFVIKNTTLKAVTKIFIVPTILTFYLLTTKTINWFLFVALVISFIGDIVLIPRDKKVVPMGGYIFLVAHIFLIVCMLTTINYSNINVAWMIVIPIIMAAIAFIFMRLVVYKYLPFSLWWKTCGYLITNGLTCAFAICLCISNPCSNTALIAIGSACFFFSDAVLVYVRLCNDKHYSIWAIVIMVTYILAQFLIMYGFIINN